MGYNDNDNHYSNDGYNEDDYLEDDYPEEDLEQREWVDSLRAHVNQEGFHYCFDGYSRWEEIKDPNFHKLRKKYLKTAQELQNYIDNQMKGSNDI